MATRLATLATIHGPKSPSSRGERKPIKRSKVRHWSERNGVYHYYPDECMELYGDMAFRKRKRRSWCRRAREHPRLFVFWYLESSIKYIWREAKAFYNEFCCDALEESMVVKKDGVVSLVDPYFSIPVTSPPTFSP